MRVEGTTSHVRKGAFPLIERNGGTSLYMKVKVTKHNEKTNALTKLLI